MIRFLLMLPALILTTRAAGPEFNRDIAPFVFANCTVCHRTGQVGPFPLTNHQEVSRRARQIAEVTADRLMPPWKPQPGHGEFHFGRRLDDRQNALFQEWLAAGKPEGNRADLPPLPVFPEGWELGKPDLILKLPGPFTIPAEGRDVYVHFPFDLKLAKDIYVTGVEVRPSNRRAAHHGVGILDSSGKARKLDAATPEQGYERFGGAGFIPAGFTPGYVPGQTPRRFDEGAAITIKKGTDFVLQMHYHPTGRVEQDQVEVGFYLTDRPPVRHMLGLLMGTEKVDIPAGEANYVQHDSFKLPVAMKAVNIWGHMHMIGRDLKVWADLPDGTMERLLWINHWDFNWQGTYQFKRPVPLPAGTVVHAEFRWDNSAPTPAIQTHRRNASSMARAARTRWAASGSGGNSTAASNCWACSSPISVTSMLWPAKGRPSARRTAPSFPKNAQSPEAIQSLRMACSAGGRGWDFWGGGITCSKGAKSQKQGWLAGSHAALERGTLTIQEASVPTQILNLFMIRL